MNKRLPLFFLFSLSLQFHLLAQCLSGNYTIGASNADYKTIYSAAEAMRVRGVCGPILFKIAPGTYNSYISISHITGSETWPITFEGTVGDSNAVIITTTANSGPIMYMTNATNVHFRYMHFQSTLDEDVIKITGAERNSFKNCRFTGRRYNLSISSSPKGGIDISNCTFTSQFYSGINCADTKNVTISGNKFVNSNAFMSLSAVDSLTIRNNSSIDYEADYYPISLTAVSNLTFVNNNFMFAGGYEEIIKTIYPSITLKNITSGNNVFANNFLYEFGNKYQGPSTTLNVIGSNIKFYHNTVHSENQNEGTSVLYIEKSNGSVFKNNILSTFGQGYAVNCGYLDYQLQNDHNDFYTKGKNLAKVYTYFCSDLKAWQEKTLTDSHSVSVNPVYAFGNLHCSESRLNKKGENIGNLFPFDIDNQPRDLSNPDIGADEFTPYSLDAAIEGFQMQSANCAGSTPFVVLLRNNGSVELNTATINWAVGSTTPPVYNWSGKLAPGETVPVALGNYDFLPKTYSNAGARVSLPNGMIDQNDMNNASQLFVSTGLKGNFTIGGTNPDYATVPIAITDLYKYGVCGPVTFNIRDGVYTDIPSIIQTFTGTSSVNTVTFKSESNDSTKVQLFGLVFKNTNFITFSKLTFKRASSSGKYLIDLSGACSNITLTNCAFKDSVIIGNATLKLIDLPTDNPFFENINITNNLFTEGNIGIYSEFSKHIGILISNNQFKNYRRAVNVFGAYGNPGISFVIKNNIISSNLSGAGISIGISDPFLIEKNIITGNIIGIEVLNRGTMNIGTIANNFINISSNYGIYINGISSVGIDLLHNTVNNSSAVKSSTALYVEGRAAGIKNINNIYSHLGGGYAIYSAGTYSVASNFKLSTKNNYYVTGKNLAYWLGDKATLADFVAASKIDSNSVSEDPLYETITDLHISHNAVLSNAGYTGTGITTDIDGETRNNPPDIGADEFTLIPTSHDAGVFVADLSGACRDSLTMRVKIKCFSTDTLRQVYIKAQLNNNQTITYHWTGKLAQFAISNTIEIGKFFVGTDSINVKAWTIQPNGGGDTNVKNDSAAAKLQGSKMNGVYTIGGTGANFPTIMTAANAVSSKGVCGPVVFKIADGKYEGFTVLAPAAGASTVNTITFESTSHDSSKVMIVHKTSSALWITGNNYILKNLGFIDSGKVASPAYSIQLQSTASNTTISNCYFKSTDVIRSFIRMEPTLTSSVTANLLISNCYLEGQETPTLNIYNGSAIGILAGPTFLIKGITITNNTIKNSFTGIYIGYADSIRILKNKITGYANTAATISRTITAIALVNKVSRIEIAGNKIWNVDDGLTLTEPLGVDRKIMNNFIQVKSGFISQSGVLENWEIYNNTISSTYKGNGSIVSFSGKCRNVIFKNNIVTLNGYGRLLNIDVLENITLDYNNYYSSSDTLALINGVVYTDFKTYQLATKQDLHSLNIKPNFLSSTDQHLNNDLGIDNRGIPVTGITTDIDGDVRNKITPDIGADEFNATHLPNDATLTAVYSDTVCDAGTSTVYVKLKNNGTTALNSVVIRHTINNISQTDYNWNGTLQPDSTILVSINGFKNNLFESNYFTANTFNPNGVTDSYPLNDTAFGGNDKVLLTGTYQIGAGTLFPTMTSALKSLMRNGICGPVTFKIKDGTYEEKLALGSVSGASSTNKITFTSVSENYNQVVLNGAKDTALKFVGSDYITLRHLTVRTNPSWAFSLMHLEGSCERIRFDSVHFINSDLTSKADSLNSSILFSNCIFESNITYSHILSQPNTTTFALKINNSTFFNTRINIYGIDTVDINNNRFTCENGKPYNDPTAISFSGRRGNISIIKNYISGFYNKGILINSSGFVLPLGNAIVNIENNSISSSNMSSGISCYDIATGNVLYNSISCLKNTVNQNSGIMFGGVKNINLKNNIIYNKYGTAVDVATSSFASSDYNVFYTDNNSFRYEGVTKNFADFKSATGTDTHSIFMNPNYISDNDLHYTNDTLNGKATPIAHITEDLQNKKRDLTHPNPGAFEVKADSIIDYTNKDLVLTNRESVTLGTNKIKITFKNTPIFNLDPYHLYKGTIDTVDISYEVTGQPKVTEQWIGKLELNQSVDFTFNQPLVITRGKIYPFTVSAHIHSSSAKDVNPFNDNINTPLNLPMAGIYTVGGTNPDFTSGDTAMLNLNACHELSAVTFAFRPGKYSLLTPNGSDTLKITSETGDAADVNLTLYSLNASNITFKNVSLSLVNETQESKSIYGVVTSGKKITVDSCIIKGNFNLSGNQYTHGFYLVNGSDISITNSTFSNFNIALRYTTSQSVSFSGNHTIANNIFENISYVFHLANSNTSDNYTINFHHNKIRNSNNGIHVNYSPSTKLNIYNNEITSLKGRAMVVQQATSPVLIYNNFISGGALLSTTYTGPQGNWQGSYFGTININSSSSAVQFINNSIYGSIELFNNSSLLFSNNSVFSDTALAIKADNLSGFAGDYNNFYSNGKALAFINNPSGNSNPLIKEIDTLKSVIISNQNSISYNPYYTSTTDLHSNSTFLKNKAKSDPNVTTDIDGQLRNTSNPDIGADEIDLKLDVVWPGDANGDSKVDNTDLLSIGLYNGSTGVARSTTGINWMPYESADWNQIQFNKVDYKHADSNGDGVINNNDTLAIFQNFGMRHNTNHKPVNPQIHSNYSIYFVIQNPQNTYKKGDVISAEVWLGKPNNEIQNCYGIAFNVGTYTSCVTPGTMKLNIQNNWLGSNQNSYRLAKTNESYGVAYGAIVRKDHTAINGYGKIAEFNFIYNGNSSSVVPLQFENIVAIDNTGKEMEVIPVNSNVIVTSIVSEEKLSDNLRCSPNPFSVGTTIQYEISNESAVKLELTNALGRHLKTLVDKKQAPGSYTINIDAKEHSMENGIYFLRLLKNESVSIIKLVLTN